MVNFAVRTDSDRERADREPRSRTLGGACDPSAGGAALGLPTSQACLSSGESSAKPEPGLGLSNAHITRSQKVESSHRIAKVCDGGNLVQLRFDDGGQQKGGGKRGRISGFSRQSRRRLLYLMASLDTRELSLPLFVTLTYPGEDWERYGGEAKTVKRHLDKLGHWIKYHHPQASAIWRQEFQKRGAPHFHLLVFGVDFIGCNVLAYEWYKIIGSEQLSHLMAGVQVKACKTWRHATGYVSKYMGKVEEFNDSGVAIHSRPGRLWGVWRSELLPIHPMFYRLRDREFYAFRRIMRGLCKSKGYKLGSLQAFSAFADSKTVHRALGFVGAEPIVREPEGGCGHE